MIVLEKISDQSTVEKWPSLPGKFRIGLKSVHAPEVGWTDGEYRLVEVAPTPPDLDDYKLKHKKLIEAEAENRRVSYITPGDGKMLAYSEIKDEALAVGNDQANPVDTDVDQLEEEQRATLEALYPLLSAEIPYRGSSYQAAANVVQTQYAGFRIVEKNLITTVNAGKAAIDAATTPSEVESAYASITWTV